MAADNVLNVKCVDESGNVLAGVKVQIQSIGTDGKWKDKNTDRTGVAKFDNLDNGAYRIVARPENRAPGLHEIVPLKGSSQESVTITCAPGDPQKKFYFEDPAVNQQAMVHMQQADTLSREQKFDAAEAEIIQSLELNPTNPDTLFYLGVVRTQAGKWALATESLKKAYEIYDALTYMPAQKDANGQALENPYVQKRNNANALMTMLPGLELKGEGSKALSNKNYEEAIAKFEQASKLIPQDPDIHYYLSVALGNTEQWDAAIKALEAAIALRPDDKAYLDLKPRLESGAATAKARAILIQGDALYNQGNYADARQKYEEALPMLPDAVQQASVWAQIGRTHTHLKQSEPALAAYRKAIELAPEDIKYKTALDQHYVILGQLYMKENQYDQAFAAYAESGRSAFQLGREWSQKNQPDMAILAFERVLKSEPVNPEAYYELGMIYYSDKKDPKLAVEMLTKYVELGKDPGRLENAKATLVVLNRKK